MATVVTPHAANQAAMAARSHELAPNLRTFAGKSPEAPSPSGEVRSAGTQTMCMSECTSMPAALRLRTVRAPAGAPPGHDAAFGRASALTLDDAARGTERFPPNELFVALDLHISR